MKRIILPAAVICALAFTSIKPSTDKTAIVPQSEGLYIFTDCKPTGDYSYVTTVKPKTVQVGKQITGCDGLCVCELTYEQIKQDFIKQVKKKYSDASGIIINTDEGTGEVIKFK